MNTMLLSFERIRYKHPSTSLRVMVRLSEVEVCLLTEKSN